MPTGEILVDDLSVMEEVQNLPEKHSALDELYIGKEKALFIPWQE